MKFSIATTTLKFRGGGKAAPARLKLSIDEGWSVQHHDSEIYELRINIFSLYIYVQMYISAGPPLGGATRLWGSAVSPKSSASALSPKLRLWPGPLWNSSSHAWHWRHAYLQNWARFSGSVFLALRSSPRAVHQLFDLPHHPSQDHRRSAARTLETAARVLSAPRCSEPAVTSIHADSHKTRWNVQRDIRWKKRQGSRNAQSK